MARKVCDLSCLGCGICNRKSPNSLFTVENFLAVADLARIREHEDEADAFIAQCPRGTILRLYAIQREQSQPAEPSQAVEVKVHVSDAA